MLKETNLRVLVWSFVTGTFMRKPGKQPFFIILDIAKFLLHAAFPFI